MKKYVLLAIGLSAMNAMAEPAFQKMDTNKDGVASYEEFCKFRINLIGDPARTTEKINKGAFQKTDTNGDGKITPEEFDAREPVISTNKTVILG